MLLENQLTFNFKRAVTWTNDQQVPQLMEVSVVPLANPSFPDQSTYVGGVQSQQVLLNDEINSVTFSLVPTYAAGLSEPVNYLAEWRQGGITGRTYSQPFAMPASDVSWDQLDNLGAYITGVNFVLQSQVGVASGVAALNASGQVVDATNTPVAVASDISTVTGLVNTEVTNRQNAINALQANTANSLTEAIDSQATTTATNLSNAVTTLSATIVSNYDTLNTAITSEATTRGSAVTSINSSITSINSSITSINTSLSTKATLTSGYLTEAQIPPYLILTAYPVSGQSQMLELSNSGNNGNLPPIHYADIAVWTSGAVWMLLGDPASPVLYPDPTVLDNWTPLTAVYSVNGDTGAVTITAASIGAVGTAGSSGTVTQAQVTGLGSTFATYTPLSSYNTLNSTVSGILSNTNIVYLDTSGPSDGFINSTKLDSNVAYVNNLSEVTLKDGTVIASGTGSVDTVNGKSGPNVTLAAADVGAIATGASIAISQVTGLQTDLNGLTSTSDSRLTNARTPTTHATTHELSGSDALALDPSQVTGLVADLAALAPLSTTNAQGNQISSLQSQVTFLLGGGTPTSSPIKAVWFDGTSTFSGVTTPSDFQNVYHVQQKSPFGLSSSTGQYYYNPAGANSNEWVYPYITPNGHLQLRTWNESNPADTVYATQTAFSNLQTLVGTLATQASLAQLQTQVNSSATQTALNTTNATVATLATQASVSSLATQVGNAATQSALNATNATVATLATQSSLNALSNTVSGLATISALNTVSAATAANTSALALKADLVSGTLPLNETPQNIPIGYISGLQTILNNTPTLSSGLLSTGVIPALPISQIINLQTDLNNLCPLVNGLVPTANLPSLSTNAVFVVANRAALVAESGATVGDIGVITGTSDAGQYILAGTPPSTFSNWILVPNPTGVTSVNGQSGVVNLTATQIGAMTTGQAIPISQITNLANWLPSGSPTVLATAAQLTSAVSPLQSLSQVQSTLTGSTMVKQPVNYVATGSVTLAGQQSIDGVLIPLTQPGGSPTVVLATAQSSPLDNGLWVVQSGSWTRTSDFALGSYFVRGTLAFVQNGVTQANTIWQETASSGTVGNSGGGGSGSANNWALVMKAGGPTAYINGNGLNLNTSTNTFSLNVVSGGGLAVTSSGATIDTSVVTRKFSANSGSSGFTAGSTVCTVTHGLGTTDIGSVYIKEVSSGNQVLAGCTVTGPNTLTIEFETAPTTNQWRCTVLA